MPLPPERGMYDPSLERDACGLGFVADLRRPPTHDVVLKGIEILRRLAHRGAAGCDPCTSDGAGILLHIPHAHYERVLGARRRRAAQRGRLRASPSAFCRATPRRAPARCASSRRPSAITTRRSSAGATCRSTRRSSGPIARSTMPVLRQLFIGRMCPVPAFERTLFMIRKRVEPSGDRGGARRLLHREPVVEDGRLQGAVAARAARLVLPRPSRRGDEEQVRARPLALQHEHVPHVGARAPVPAHRAQRRDQHAARQPDVDARARGAPRERGVRRAPRRLQADHPARRQRLGVARQRRRLPRRGRAQPAARHDDARPGGVGGAAGDAAREARVLRVPRVARRAVGRAGGARLHRRRLPRRDARPQRPPAR